LKADHNRCLQESKSPIAITPRNCTSKLDTLVTAKEKANMLALGKKILGALLVLAGTSDLFVREPAHTITGPLLIAGGVALFLWGMRA
jgi:hypothetical protein